MRKTTLVSVLVLTAGVFAGGCDDDEVSSEEEARKAYESLDPSIDKAIDLGFAGFNAATSANIDPQTTNGAKAGTLTVGGKVDQGSSENKNMTLNVGMVGYSDDGEVTYDTTTDAAAQPVLTMSLKGVPTGTMDGTMVGEFTMSGELEGVVTLNIVLSATLEPDPVTGKVHRAPGTTHITGTAVSPHGTYNIDVTR